MDANAEVLLVKKNGCIILQLRDDKPEITNPGFVSSFGGKIEYGETPQKAALREIREETNLRPRLTELVYFGKYRKNKDVHGEDWDVYYFLLNDVEDRGLEVYEGRGYVVLDGKSSMGNYKLTTLLKEVLEDYFCSLLQNKDR